MSRKPKHSDRSSVAGRAAKADASRPRRYHYRVIARYLFGVHGPLDTVIYTGPSEDLAREYLRESEPGHGSEYLVQRVPHEAWETLEKKDFDDFIRELKAKGVKA
jgi:hypothetical protein